ncbi:transcriptional regulator [Kordiimonas sp. SCSIO 12610]|uniref:helix-turn-helix transcriptional regulator n=1 Tax=Kordiimonas sp. SCSIO 12610 TaxID=2829597 RepID=UPI00210B8643|nr:PAS domain-containing protein [Kordiimonas sp. SCSIO 12610]UTW54888.1 PAS domain-containing protein [Kordiimonas sp. SCSIO 12610]
MLEKYHNIADGIAMLFAPYVEVVIHDLATEQVTYIANNISKRTIGEPSLLHEIDFKPSDSVIGPYEKTNWDGKRIKSISSVLRNTEGRPTGILCINADMSHFHMAQQALSALISSPDNKDKPVALFKEDWHERINQFITDWTQDTGTSISQLSQKQKKTLVFALAQNGAFEGKQAATYVCRVLGIARATLYNYLKQQREK